MRAEWSQWLGAWLFGLEVTVLDGEDAWAQWDLAVKLQDASPCARIDRC